MLCIAICDDEPIAIEYLVDLLKDMMNIDTISSFSSQQELLEATKKQTFHIIFMDIDWKDGPNGILLSRKLFELCPDTQIIYVTGYNDRFSQHIFLTDSNLTGYLVKPVQKDLLERVLERAFLKMKTQSDKFTIDQKGVIRSIPYRDIYYMESRGHNVIIHTITEEIEIYARLEHCKQKLPNSFLQCHKSYLVNMDYINYINKNVIILENQWKVPISRSRYESSREHFFRYMGGK